MSESEVETGFVSGSLQHIEPHWDNNLKTDQVLRVRFLQRLAEIGLGVFRRSFKSKIGFFTVEKKGGKQRLVLDARSVNSCHRSPPTVHLGGPGALSRLDLSDATLARENPIRPDLHAASLDLVDSFYQFYHLEFSEYFGVEFGEEARVFGATSVYEDGHFYPVEPTETVYFCFVGLPMGWTWAMVFAQGAMESFVQAGVGDDDSGIGGMVRDGMAVPIPQPGRPIAAVYVDNVAVLGYTKLDACQAMAKIKHRMDELGFAYHEEEEASQ
eukprot:4208518-Amphidinium_carterae.1